MLIKKPTNMYVNQKRRTFLKGLVAAGLVPALSAERIFAASAGASQPLRFLFIPLKHGWGTGGTTELEGITGTGSGISDFDLPSFWSPLDAIKDKCVFVDGLRGTFWGNAHDVSYSDIFTAAVPANSPASDALGGPFPLPIGPSIDSVFEGESGKAALRFSANYSSFGASHHPLSFNDERFDNLPYYRSAIDAYNALFTNLSDGSGGEPVREDLVLTELFTHLASETEAKYNGIPVGEQNKLLGYLDSVGALENRLILPSSGGDAVVDNIPTAGQDFEEEISSYLDMIRVAFTNDSHRVAVLGLGDNADEFTWTDASDPNTVHTGIGNIPNFQSFHHTIAHFEPGANTNETHAYKGWVEYYAQRIADFALELDGISCDDGTTLLDNTVIVLTGEVGHGFHDRTSKPHIIIGGGNHGLAQGKWFETAMFDASNFKTRDYSGNLITYSTFGKKVSEWSHADLFVTLAGMAGLSIPTFGIEEMNNGALPILASDF